MEDAFAAHNEIVEEAARRTERAVAEAARRTERAVAEAAEENKRTTANDWKLRSRTRTKEGYSLYESGMYEDALGLALKAIDPKDSAGDPSNIDGFLLAAACLQAQRRSGDAKQIYEKQIKLLDTAEYRSDTARHHQVLKNLPADTDLLDMLTAAIKRRLGIWKATDESAKHAALMLQNFRERRRLHDAALLLKWLFTTKTRWPEGFEIGCVVAIELVSQGHIHDAMLLLKWLFTTQTTSSGGFHVGCAVVKKLASQGFIQEAQQLIETLSSNVKSLLDQADFMEVCACIGQESIQSLTQFVQGLDFKSKWKMIEGEIAKLKACGENGEVSAETVARIMGAMSSKYSEWKPEIEKDIYQSVVSTFSHVRGYGRIMGVIICGIAWMALLMAVGMMVDFKQHNPLIVTFGGFFGSLFGAILIADLGRSLVRRFRLRQRLPNRLEAAFTAQNKAFQELGLPLVTPMRPSGISPWAALLLYTAVIAIYLILWEVVLTSTG